jgi:hypothetical protein
MQKLYIATILCFLNINVVWGAAKKPSAKKATHVNKAVHQELLSASETFTRGKLVTYAGQQAHIELDQKKTDSRTIFLSQPEKRFCGQTILKKITLLSTDKKPLTWSEITPGGTLLTIAGVTTATLACFLIKML